MGVRLTAAATASAVVVRNTEEEVNHLEVARVTRVLVLPPNRNVLPPFLPSLRLPYNLSPNVTITERSFFLNNMWYTESIIKRTEDDSHVYEYHVVTRSEFKNNITLTVCKIITPNSEKHFLLNSIRTWPM